MGSRCRIGRMRRWVLCVGALSSDQSFLKGTYIYIVISIIFLFDVSKIQPTDRLHHLNISFPYLLRAHAEIYSAHMRTPDPMFQKPPELARHRVPTPSRPTPSRRCTYQEKA